jgi:hypothetical protein
MICTVEGCEEHYGCRLRTKSVQTAPSATPSRHNHLPPAKHQFNSWERGIAGESRPGGTRMPYLHANGDPVRLKTYTENRAHFDEIRRKQMTQETSHA